MSNSMTAAVVVVVVVVVVNPSPSTNGPRIRDLTLHPWVLHLFAVP